MNIMSSPEINTTPISVAEIAMTYPGGGVWSRKAIAELLKQLNGIGCTKVNSILDENPNIQQAGNPTELAEALSDHIPKGIVLLPIYNKYGGNVSGTLMAIMDYYEKNGVMPRILGNVEIEIEHCLCGKPGQTEEQIKKGSIYSHIQAIKQCNSKINEIGLNAIDVNGTSVKLEEAKEKDGILLLLDKDTARKNGLEIYNEQMGPENNRTSFAVITSDPDIELPKIEGNKDINVGIIEVDNSHGGLLLSLMPLILLRKPIDMKAITSSLNGDSPMIGIVSKSKRFDQTKGMYAQLTNNNNKDALGVLMRKLNIILKRTYNIKVEHNDLTSYTISSDNEPGALIKMLILLEYNKINLDSINSKIEGNEVQITVETNDDIGGMSESNISEGIKEHLSNLIDNNIDRIHEIITK